MNVVFLQRREGHLGVGTSIGFYKGQKGLSLEKPEKSPKRGSWGLLALAEQARKRVENEPKT